MDAGTVQVLVLLGVILGLWVVLRRLRRPDRDDDERS
jgi:hypothetical protein